MRFSDYTRLGRISIKSRKKSTKNTVTGIAFALIMLVSVIFLALAAFVNFNAELNKVRTLATFTLEAKNFDDTSGSTVAKMNESGWEESPGLASYGLIREIAESGACEEKLTASYFSFSQSGWFGQENLLSYKLGDAEFKDLNIGRNVSFDGQTTVGIPATVRVCNLAESGGKYILDAEYEDMKDKAVLAAGQGFSGGTGGAKEIVVSEDFAAELQSGSAESLIGKKLSFKVAGQYSYYGGHYVNNSSNPADFDINDYNQGPRGSFSLEIMSGFKIAGVISSDFFKLPTRVNEAHIWITEKSLYYTEDGAEKSVMPVITSIESDDGSFASAFVYSYPGGTAELTAALAAEKGVFFPFLPALQYNQSYGRYYGGEAVTPSLNSVNYLQAKNFSEAVTLASVISSKLAAVYPGFDSGYINDKFQTAAYGMFTMLFTALQVVILILFIFGGVIFVTSLLNLYNSINYSVQARRNYMGVMRAIGARQQTIPKMYFVEMVLIFLRTLIWVLVFGFGICFGMKALIDYLVKSTGAGDFLMGMNISLNFVYFPVALGVVYAALFIIGAVFSIVACNAVSRKPILDILRTEV